MPQSIFLGPSSYGPEQDSPRAVEEKLNSNFAELYALNPSLTGRQTIRITFSADNGTPDSARITQTKINSMLSELSAVAGLSAPEIILSSRNPSNAGITSRVASELSSFFSQLAATPVLGTLALSSTAVTRGAAFTTNITGATSGSTLTATGLPAGLTINSGARTITGTTNDSAGSKSIVITETKAGTFGSPKAAGFTLVLT